MAEVPTEEVGAGSSTEGDISDQQQQCLSSESLAEWRSSEQLENGSPSTSPPYWDSDADDDGGPKPTELYGKYTWKIDKFPQINKRELRSNPFEVGGYKWYILIYPQGCDVCNHLSLFLCVANHDKLPPGWSHFAQFTIAVVNKDPKKSKYSDTLHRFWKKEHDWGWKKFMELSKVVDGYIDSDTLIIKAQVQVIRERADRPFRCLDCQYRRELVRVYLTNVEQVCKRFVEEKRNKLGKLIEDKVRWSSFCAFWQSTDYSSRCCMSQEKTDSILKVVVKHFFIEKEVTSTLVMDSLYSGLKALEGLHKGETNNIKYLDSDDLSVPIVRMENDMFVLDDDVLPLLERAVIEPLPAKDEKSPQSRLKDGALGEEFNKDSIERDERRLTELGRWTIEIFILTHIFSKIEVAYQEAVSLKKQEELIREEEAACLAETEQRSRRGAADKEKKSKKKQGKQKRNNRKGKDKRRDEKPSLNVQVEMEIVSFTTKSEDIVSSNNVMLLENSVAPEDSDSVDCLPERPPRDSKDRDVTPLNWDTDTSEAHLPTEASSSGVSGLSNVQNGTKEKSCIVDDGSSTSSSDSFHSIPQKSNTQHHKCKKSSRRRGRSHRIKQIIDSESRQTAGYPNYVGSTSKVVPVTTHSSHNTMEEDASAGLRHSSKEIESFANQKLLVNVDATASPVFRTKLSPDILRKCHTNQVNTFKISAQKSTTQKAIEKASGDSVIFRSEKLPMDLLTVGTDKLSVPPLPVVSRPGSAPIVPISRVSVSTQSMVPTLARSVSVAGRLSPESSTTSQSYVPLSYRNAILSRPVTRNPVTDAPVVSTPQFSQYGSDNMDMHHMKSALPFGMMNHDQNWLHSSQSNALSDEFTSQNPALRFRVSSHVSPEEFPHLDIINDLLDDENGVVEPHSGYRNSRLERGNTSIDERFRYSYLMEESQMIPQATTNPYLISSQWQVSGPERPVLNVRSSEDDTYLYRLSEYRKMSIGSNGFPVYRPSNGH